MMYEAVCGSIGAPGIRYPNALSAQTKLYLIVPSPSDQAILNRGFRLRQLARRQVNITAGFVGQVAAETWPSIFTG
jgi:hypothetical protein